MVTCIDDNSIDKGRVQCYIRTLPHPVTPPDTEMSTQFRLRGGAHLFTWAQVTDTTTHVDVVQLLGDAAKAYIIAKENHQDGGVHFHAYVEWKKPQDRILGESFYLSNQRPNVKPKRSKPERRAARDYCRKDGDFIESGFDTDPDTEEEKPSESLKKAYEESKGDLAGFIESILDRGITTPLALAYFRAKSDDWKLQTHWDDSFWRDHTISSFALQVLSYDHEERRSYVLIGDEGVGKTAWAGRNLPKPLLWVRSPDDLKSFRPQVHKSILVDDISVKDNKRSNQLNWVEKGVRCTVYLRYNNAKIPAGIPRMFTCNFWDPVVDLDDKAIARRCYVIECKKNEQ